MANVSLPDKIRRLDPTKLASTSIVRRPTIKGKLIQGTLRAPNSRAARRYRELESARLKKALKHITHGKNIFAYNHLRTNQVVYSLTRALDSHNVLSQMIYHGKKTVPPNLRKDMWTPYFSLHFPSSTVGLKAYRLLRELSVQRQLAPTPDMITNTEENMVRMRPKDPLKAEKWDEEWKSRIGQIMGKKRRARTLMDQKATSVADVAAMLSWQNEDAEREAAKGEDEGDKGKKMSNKARKRLVKVRRQEEKRRNELAKRVESLAEDLSDGKTPVTIEEPKEVGEYDVQEGEVKILWADLNDAEYAESWPGGISHGELERRHDHIMQGQKRIRAEPAQRAAIEAGGEEKNEKKIVEELIDPEQLEDTPSAKSGLGKLKFWKK